MFEIGGRWKLCKVDDFSFGPISHAKITMLFGFSVFVVFDYSEAGLEFVNDTWAGG